MGIQARCIAELGGRLGGWKSLDEEGSKHYVLTVSGVEGLRNRWARVRRSLELSSMMPRSHPDSRSFLDAIGRSRNPLKCRDNRDE